MIRTARQTAILAQRDRLLQIQAEYREDVAYHRANGHRAHYCIHGTNLWTDYDNICGGCEDGTFTEYTAGTDLLILARDDVDAAERERARWIARRLKTAREYFAFCWEIQGSLPTPMATAFQMVRGSH